MVNFKVLPFILTLSFIVSSISFWPDQVYAQLVDEGFYFPVAVDAGDIIETDDHKIRVDRVVEGIRVPWGMAFLPDGRVLITERSGDLYLVENGRLAESTIQGVPEVVARNQGGLLDVQLHPDYEENGWIYLSYSYNGENGTGTAIMRARLDGMQLTDRQVLFQASPQSNRVHHFGSRIVFDNQNYLYFSIGDRGEMQNAQDLTTHSGGVFRLHDDGSVPDDNPFNGSENAKPEFWTYGNRNIQGMAVHPGTGEIWAHEHGPRGGDEVNIIKKGNNYGWPEITYGINYNGTTITDQTEKEGMEQPFLYWDPSIAPSGMDFVTGDRYPNWKGDLMVGSLSFQYLHRVDLDGSDLVKQEELLKDIGRVRSVKVAPDGYIYAGVENLGIIRILPVE